LPFIFDQNKILNLCPFFYLRNNLAIRVYKARKTEW
jgi:hypothetical protein